jgi:prepilin-type N-terminal cleavage/methylation domain-containing protein
MLINNQRGFTLVEIIAVLIILSILAAVAVPKFINLSTGDKMATQVVAELTTREKLTWMNIKLGLAKADDTTIDALVFSAVDYNIGAQWISGPGKSGGTINIDGTTVVLQRTLANLYNPAIWSR